MNDTEAEQETLRVGGILHETEKLLAAERARAEKAEADAAMERKEREHAQAAEDEWSQREAAAQKRIETLEGAGQRVLDRVLKFQSDGDGSWVAVYQDAFNGLRAALASPSESAPPKDQGAGAAPPAAPPGLCGVCNHPIGTKDDYLAGEPVELRDRAFCWIQYRGGSHAPALAQPPAPQEGLFEKGARAMREAAAQPFVERAIELEAQIPHRRQWEDRETLRGEAVRARADADQVRAMPIPAEPSAPQAVAARLTDAQLLGDPAQTVSWPAHPPAPPAPVSAPQDNENQLSGKGK